MNKIKKSLQIFSIIFNIIVLALILLLFYLIQPIKTEKIIYIEQGSITKIITQLAKDNVNITPPIDKYIIRFLGYPQAGWIDMRETLLTKADYLYNLSHAKAAVNDITLIPGETAYVFLQQISTKLDLSFELLYKYFSELSPYEDGWLVPDTYHIPIGISEEKLIKYLIDESTKYHIKLSNELLGEYNEKEWLRILTIASITQKEAANNNEMPLVSSVIYNRLKINMKLQMDGTLNYGKYSHIRVTPTMIREDVSKYNTYLHYGIPPNPICAVNKSAIKAAIFPAETGYLYFVKKNDNEHFFTYTYEEHLKKIK